MKKTFNIKKSYDSMNKKKGIVVDVAFWCDVPETNANLCCLGFFQFRIEMNNNYFGKVISIKQI